MNAEEIKKYEVAEPEGFWLMLSLRGDSDEERIDYAERKKDWESIDLWGDEGYDLGNPPYHVILHRDRECTIANDAYQLVEYSEGSVTMYACPTREIRDGITDLIAFTCWKTRQAKWVQGYETVDQLPPQLRGPYYV